ncbi:MAG: 50S ribosomal protein L4 [bacterium]|nr:50S ribosomal protein L4 [bacterium]
MASAKVYKMDGSESGSVDLNDTVFSVDMNSVLVHDVAVALQNARRQGNAETKRRAEVRGGGAKPYRQKGTGSARHGSTREPQMRGGGVVFGPHKRSYKHKVPVAVRRKALCCALSDRVRGDALHVLDAVEVPEPKTKPLAEMATRLPGAEKRLLLVTAAVDRNLLLSARNLPRVTITTATDLNTLDVLNAGRVVVVQDALAKLEERLS